METWCWLMLIRGVGCPISSDKALCFWPTLLFSLLHVSVSSVGLIQPRLKMTCIQNLLWFVCNKHQATIGAAGISDASPLPSLIPKDELVNKTLSVNGSSAFGNILIERQYNTPRGFWISNVSYSPKCLKVMLRCIWPAGWWHWSQTAAVATVQKPPTLRGSHFFFGHKFSEASVKQWEALPRAADSSVDVAGHVWVVSHRESCPVTAFACVSGWVVCQDKM